MKKARDVLIYFAYKYAGDYDAILAALRRKEKIDDNLFMDWQCKWDAESIITIVDDDYPETFKTVNRPPIVLFFKGDKTLLLDLSKAIAVIGAREHSTYGAEQTIAIVRELATQNFVIVSGLARGIDGIAHQESLNANGKTIAVLGSGIDYPYPASNKHLYEAIAANGLIISEYPSDTKPQPHFFKIRNRLVAALTNGVLIIEAKYRSGTVITVGYALEKGSDIYCIPERVGQNSGCNRLIKDGAYLVETATDIIDLWRD